jgi:hypothetical protein
MRPLKAAAPTTWIMLFLFPLAAHGQNAPPSRNAAAEAAFQDSVQALREARRLRTTAPPKAQHERWRRCVNAAQGNPDTKDEPSVIGFTPEIEQRCGSFQCPKAMTTEQCNDRFRAYYLLRENDH